MRSVSTLILLCLAGVTNAFTLPQNPSSTTINGHIDPAKPLLPIVHGPQKRTPHCYTNAECLRRGLPLRPAQAKRARALAPRQSACTPSTFSGRVEVRTVGDASSQGYLQPLNGGGLYSVNPAPDTAAVFTFSTCLNTEGQSTEPFSVLLAPEQNPDGFPYFTFVSGYANNAPVNDLSVNSANYLWATNSVAQTATLSPAVQIDNLATGSGSNLFIESAVWRYNDNTGRLTVDWVNTDGTIVGPVQHFIYSGGLLGSAGSRDQFEARFGGSTGETYLYLVVS